MKDAPDLIVAARTFRVACAFGMLVLLLGWETFAPMYEWSYARIRHGVRNLTIGLLNTILVAVFFVQMWLWAADWAQAHHFGLLNQSTLSLWFRIPAALFIFDGWMYAWHRLNHRMPFLWRFHRAHHADRFMDVTSATRFHLGEIALSSLIRIPLIAIFGLHFAELAIYETILFAVVQFHHANIQLPRNSERILSAIIVTPSIHRVHHSHWQPETDSNYSSLLSFWDRVFRTSRANNPEKIQFGLDEYPAEMDSVASIMKTPLGTDAR